MEDSMSRAQHKGKELCAEIDVLHRTFDLRDCQNEPQYRNNMEYFFANHGKKKCFIVPEPVWVC
jgi:hypothetical protein